MEGLKNFIVYIDDLFVHSKSHEEHVGILGDVLKRLAENNMEIYLAKCHFGNIKVSYLGFRLTPKGITCGKDKFRAVEKPKFLAQEKRSSHLSDYAIFFSLHVKDFPKLCAPLNKATRKDSPYQKGPIRSEALEAHMRQ